MGISERLRSWDEIAENISQGDLNFDRTQKVADIYRDHRRHLAKEWLDLNSYIKHRYLKYPYSMKIVSEVDDSGNIEEYEKKYVSPDAEYRGKRIVMADNEFPYAFSPEISHKVIWSVEDLCAEDYRQFVNRDYPEEDYDIMVFVNPVHLKSVRGVHHGHALIRRNGAWKE
uniref:uncharacterized protein YPL067C-like n=1 Tax=Styela clava TaxID=7725 RepID=UPI0019392FF3|nr:uncharacterized protein YPL067C-like [Styela clava]